MRDKDDTGENDKSNGAMRMPWRRRLLLEGLYRIRKTSLLIPLDVYQMRYRYPDTWCVAMFRRMVPHVGLPGPSDVLNAALLKSRTLRSLRWGIFYCLFDKHKRNCVLKAVNPLYQSHYLLSKRPIVTSVVQMGLTSGVLGYHYQRQRAQEHNVLMRLRRGLRSTLKDQIQYWPITALYASVVASTLLHPLDVVKVRLQLYPEAWGLSLFRNMMRCEGWRAPYTGLTASILRQTTYTTSRLGTYYCLYEYQKGKYNNVPSFPQKLVIGMYAGLVGAFVGCPSEIILVRMMADGPVDPYRRYRGPMDAFNKIWRTEGFCTLWRGALLTMSRSVVISVSQIGTYAQARNYLVERKRAKGVLLHLYTSMFASLVTAAATLPLDTFKTRYQVISSGTHKDVYQKFRQETGILGFWRGFTPYYVRLTVHTLITFYLLELLYDAHRTRKKSPFAKD